MAILTWQNIQAPQFDDRGLRTASDLLQRAMENSRVAGQQIMDLETAQKTAETEAANRFVLEQMLAIDDPNQLKQSMRDGSLFGPARGFMSPEMLTQADARQDVLNMRGDQAYARDRTKVVDQRADAKHADEQALQARRQARAPELAAAYTNAIKTGRWDAVDKLLASNPDFQDIDNEFKTIFGFARDRQQLSMQWADKAAKKKGDERNQWIMGEAGDLVGLLPTDRAEVNRRLGRYKKADRYEIQAALQKLAPNEFAAYMNSPPSVGGAPVSGSGSQGSQTNAPTGPDDIVTRSIQQSISSQQSTDGARIGKEAAEKYAGQTSADISKKVADTLGVDIPEANKRIASLQDKFRDEAGNPTISVAEAAAVITQPGVHQSGMLWGSNYDDNLATQYADALRKSKVGNEGTRELEGDLRKYNSLHSETSDLANRIRRTEDQLAYADDPVLRKSLGNLQHQYDQKSARLQELYSRYALPTQNAPAAAPGAPQAVPGQLMTPGPTELDRSVMSAVSDASLQSTFGDVNLARMFGGPPPVNAQAAAVDRANELLSESAGVHLSDKSESPKNSAPLASNPKKASEPVSSSETVELSPDGSLQSLPPLEVPKGALGKPQTLVEAAPGAIPEGEGQKVVVTYVQDGDTFGYEGSQGARRVCRIDSINTPETANKHKKTGDQFYGPESREHLKSLIDGKQVSIKFSRQDKHGRDVCQVEVEGMAVDAEMIKANLAWFIKDVEMFADPVRGEYLRGLENEARKSGQGVFTPGLFPRDLDFSSRRR